LAGYGLQCGFSVSRQRGNRFSIALASRVTGEKDRWQLPLGWVLNAALLLVLILSLRDVYTVNRGFAFAPRLRNAKSFTALNWLKNHDPDLYYTSIGGDAIFWDWTATAYELEMPVINFDYGRRLVTYDAQRHSNTQFFAKPKYVFAQPDQQMSPAARLLRDFDGVNLWSITDALPFAFSVGPDSLRPGKPLSVKDVSPLAARLDGPNRVVVNGEPSKPGDRLIVLVSDYPGWRLSVDGQPGKLLPENDYLGAAMLPGEHTYSFVFRPSKHYIGLGISVITAAILVGIAAADSRRWPVRSGPGFRS
jgi:hypothetical protein